MKPRANKKNVAAGSSRYQVTNQLLEGASQRVLVYDRMRF